MMWLYDSLNNLGDSDFSNFTMEGNTIEAGFDSGATTVSPHVASAGERPGPQHSSKNLRLGKNLPKILPLCSEKLLPDTGKRQSLLSLMKSSD